MELTGHGGPGLRPVPSRSRSRESRPKPPPTEKRGKPNGAASYRKGAGFERETRAALEATGWIVTRSPASHSSYDLHASRRCPRDGGSITVLVQCKTGGAMRPVERLALIEDAKRAGAYAVAARRLKGGEPLFAWVGLHALGGWINQADFEAQL